MDKIAVLDFGGQYAHLIANRVRRLGVYSEIVDPEASLEKLKEYRAFILSGGPASVNAANAITCNRGIFELGVPVLAICYGHQLTAKLLGGEVEKGQVREYGQANIHFTSLPGIFDGIKKEESVWMSHFDQVAKMPEGFEKVASTEDCDIAAMVDKKRQIYSIQFHPEVTHTQCGMRILENFIELSDAKREWDIEKYIETITKEIQDKVGEKKVFLMISGGVDSTVAFLLLAKALGEENVYGLLVDTGMMRLNEVEEVKEALKELGVNNLHVYDGGEEYFKALKEVYEPEAKRKIIGDLFLDIKEKVSEELKLDPDVWMLGQGTIYPDTIESGESKHADKIKTHHNRVDRVQELCRQGKVIEPLDQLYKDEVRMVGEKLGLNDKMVWRHPFPGPGLGVRTLCSEGQDELENIKDVELRIAKILEPYGLKGAVLPVKSVGVQGDERTYRHPAVVYGKRLEWSELNKVSTQLTNQLPEINRVVYALNKSDFASLSSRNCYLNEERVLTIQKADKVVMDFISEVGIDRDIWQFPTVMIPAGYNEKDESIVLRPVESTEAMTASFYYMNWEHVDELTKRLEAVEGISNIFYDITNKPPGTIEWE